MSAFAITLDAILALMVTWLVVTMSMQAMASKEYNLDDYIVRYSYDFLAVAEKSGALDRAIQGDGSEIKEMIREMLPESMCIELEVYTPEGSLVHQAQNFCIDGNKVFTATRTVVYNDKVYWATTKMWYKYEE